MKQTLFILLCGIVFLSCERENTIHVHEEVDLGLPSGTLWSTCNIGADSPEDFGSYFAWGETDSKTNFTVSNYTFKGNEKVLLPEHDAATINWGKSWRMPTIEEFDELLTYCKWTKTYVNGVPCAKISSKAKGNSNYIYLPAAGGYVSYMMEENEAIVLEDVGEAIHYWSSSSADEPYACFFESSMSDVEDGELYGVEFGELDSWNRCFGFPIRPVRASN